MSTLNRIVSVGKRLAKDPEVFKKVTSVARSTAEMVRHDPASIKHLKPWLTSLLPHHTTVADEIPWVNFDAIAWLESWLRPDMRVFEYGSGGSSLFFARRAGHVTSIEHDDGFFDFIAGVIDERNITNLDLLHLPPVDDGQRLPYDGLTFRSFSQGHETHSFENYVKAIDGFDDASFDLVIVDGRARASCVMRAIPKVKPGGAILLDNAEREPYGAVQEHLRDLGWFEQRFRSLGPCNTYVWETTVFRRSRA
ncbi:MAG: hypothetical protein R3E66_12375 [bacterium]